MSRKMFVPFHGDGIISQFEGYEDLEELDWDGYRAKYGNIQRLDRILRAEGDDPDRYKLAKQADTVMLFFLFADEELRATVRAARLHVSRLTRARANDRLLRPAHVARVDAELRHARRGARRLDPESSWERFLVALESDVGDVQGGTTKEGIHLGVMCGTLDLIQRGYLGSRIRDGVLLLRAAAHRPARRPVVPDAVPRHADHGDAAGGRADASPCRPRASAGRSGSASATMSASCVRATSATFALAARPAAAHR